MSFFLDKKGPKNQGPTEICMLARLWREQSLKFRKKIFFCGISSTTLFRQISEWPENK
jgi:hypothetical protein